MINIINLNYKEEVFECYMSKVYTKWKYNITYFNEYLLRENANIMKKLY